MAAPRYSIVIPTRERAHTLRHSLRTCLDIDYDDYEIVVCDNCGSPATRQVVEEADSPRVVYVRSDAPLSMSLNWELAASRARGEYVTLLGDDDGFMPFALRAMDSLAERHPFRLCHWVKGIYTWPCFPKPEDANYLNFPTTRKLETVDGRRLIESVVAEPDLFPTLPMIYNAMVRRDLLDELRHKAGTLFPTKYPDVYSGFALAYLSGRHLSTSVPMTIGGASGKSTGMSYVVHNKQSPIAEEFDRLNQAGKLLHHPWIPDLSGIPNAVLDSFLQAKAKLFPNNASLRADRRAVADAIARSIADAEPTARAAAFGLLRNTLMDDPGLLAWFDALPDPGPPPRYAAKPARFGAEGGLLHLHADRFGIQNIHDAVKFSSEVLFPSGTDVRYDVPSEKPRTRGLAIVGREVGRLMKQGARLLGLAEGGAAAQ